MIEDKILNSILDGRSLLITGSGINNGVKNLSGNNFSQGKELTMKIYSACGIDNPEDEYDLQDATQTFLERKNADELIALIKKELQVSSISETVKTIYNLPWNHCYTTNYDDVPLLCTEGRSQWIPVTLDKKTNEYMANNRICVYVNGYIGKLDENTLNNQFKLSTKSYLSEENIINSQWGAVLKADLEMAETIVIIGLSLDYDLDLKRIISSREISEKTVFIEKKDYQRIKKENLAVMEKYMMSEWMIFVS